MGNVERESCGIFRRYLVTFIDLLSGPGQLESWISHAICDPLLRRSSGAMSLKVIDARERLKGSFLIIGEEIFFVSFVLPQLIFMQPFVSLEKHSASTEVVKNASKSVVSVTDGDEALKLVGKEREAQFSEEYNLQLRGKLVCLIPHELDLRRSSVRLMSWCDKDRWIPPLCAAVYFTQFL